MMKLKITQRFTAPKMENEDRFPLKPGDLIQRGADHFIVDRVSAVSGHGRAADSVERWDLRLISPEQDAGKPPIDIICYARHMESHYPVFTFNVVQAGAYRHGWFKVELP